MIDTKTERLQLPLPNVENYLEDDVARLADALQILDEKVATVGEDGKVIVEQLPAVAITDTFPVQTQEEMLSLNAQPGDVAIRSDLSKSFILMLSPANVLGNWKELLNDALVQLSKPDGYTKVGGLNKVFDYVTPEMYGAKGDALISKANPLSLIISGTTAITNPDATDDSAAVMAAINSGKRVVFDGSKGYLVSRSFPISSSNTELDGNGCAIVYRGGRELGVGVNARYGIFQVQGSYDRYALKAYPTGPLKTLRNELIVSTATNTLKRGDYTLLYARNAALDSEFLSKVKTEAHYSVQVRKVINNGDGNSTLVFDYKSGFDWSAEQITLGTSTPIENVSIKNFILIDEMAATPTPDVLPVPEAPSIEKQEAVALVRAVCCANSKFENLKSYNAKYSTVDVFGCNNCVFSDVETYFPTWYGGGEGYSVRIANSIYCTTNRANMIGGRHVIDYTMCGHCTTNDSHGETDQVSFSMHTNSEHDITFNRCTGGDFYLANEVYGLSCCRVRLVDCRFDFVRINCLDLDIDRCNLNDFQATCSRLTIRGGSVITDFQFAIKDSRTYADDILRSYALPGILNISNDTVITRKKGYISGTKLQGWFHATVSNQWNTLAGDSRLSLNCVDVAKLRVNGVFNNTIITSSGVLREVDLTGASADVSEPSTSAFYNISGLNIDTSYHASFILRGMCLRLNGTMRPFQIVTRSDSFGDYNAVVSEGGNVFINCLQGQVRDSNKTSPKLTITGICYNTDAYNNGLQSDIYARNFQA